MNDRWLNPEFLSYVSDLSSWSDIDPEEWQEHYKILEHAEELFSQNSSKQNLIAGIAQLDRAVELRKKHLDKYYNFKKIDFVSHLKKNQILENLKIIKPLMQDKLNQIRNGVVHVQSAKVPSTKECKELAEFVWYYLRTTDRLSSQLSDMLTLTNRNNGDHVAEIRIDLKTWTLEVACWLGTQGSKEKIENWIRVKPTKVGINVDGQNYLFGKIYKDQEAYKKILITYFSAI